MAVSDFALLTLGIGLLATLSIGGILAAVFYPQISGQSKVNKRMASVSTSVQKRNPRDVAGDHSQQRRKQVQETLKELEAKQKSKKKRVRLSTLIKQAGLTLSPRSFIIISVVFGVVFGVVLLFTGASILIAVGGAFAGGFGFPRWVLLFKRKRRQNKFIDEFANAIDVVVRGIKAGLPINDCLNVIASESPAPVGPEFREVVEGQKLGVTLQQGLERMYEHVPVSEVSFLAIVIAIQQQTGGNLAEALANLSKVLRDRKKMAARIRSMSQEAKSSASIIGFLPIGVMGLVYMSTPQYIALLWTEQLGHVMLLGSAFWMMCGILVMRKMINFDF